MIAVEEADKIIFGDIKEFPSVQMPLQDAVGMVLREDLIADRDLPPFNRATMDGIALHFASWESGNRNFPIEGIQKAGQASLTLNKNSSCIEIMTGAVLPDGCDCIIPVEHIGIDKNSAKVDEDFKLTSMLNVHAQGSDHKSGSKLVGAGARLYAPQIAVAASIGKAEVRVTQSPKIAVIGTGDELVGIDQKPESFQIRQSNSYALCAALLLHGFSQVERFHMRDNKSEMQAQLGQILNNYDVIILSGGVSMGKFDFIPEVLENIGVKVHFHKVKQRPGKPFWFGKSKDGKPVFALPGNPVSTQVGMIRYILPYLNRVIGVQDGLAEFAVLAQDIEIKTPFTNFLQVKLEGDSNGRLQAIAIIPNSSGDFASLAQSDGFLELPPETFHFSKGFPARLFRWVF